MITSYLLKLDKWQLYDIELFINCFFSFDDAIISTLIKRLDKDLGKYDFTDHRTKATVALYCNLCLVYIQRKEFSKTKIYFEKIRNFKIPNEFILERMFQTFFAGLELIINGNKLQGKGTCQNVLKGLKLLKINDYYLMFNEALAFTIRNMD